MRDPSTVMGGQYSLPFTAAVALTRDMSDPLVYDPSQPGHHPGPLPYYYRYRILSPDWFERRDSVTQQAGDAVAANQAIQMRDPWPPYVNNRTILFNGQVIISVNGYAELFLTWKK